MSADTHSHHDDHHGDHASHGHGTMGQLMIGFALAAILTIIPFYLVMAEVEMSRTALVGIIMGLGAVQIIVHLVFFLHLNTTSEEGSTFMATLLAVIILVIVLAGSLWVMHNMNENMMPMHDMEQMLEEMQSLQSQQG
ncbi:cytochrome o ubiquinol oxidase subunit IV [Celeribacter sp. HF31]|uniref:cytochrome o ubiquinol oxidase subunit IV n=1 Tax=Celeribacter sp. HF31 TaxID=2721558 RepID=UPI00142FC7F1|nr:cytochrome o ubiquinol oxidase subunit IV [Celeribacter sp. HF31]NIY78870.1 cytochrome o ubiquinol oxidase subunit IV [Celeribacter sp. HF31]